MNDMINVNVMKNAITYVKNAKLPFPTVCPYCGKLAVIERDKIIMKCAHWYNIGKFKRNPDFYEEIDKVGKEVDLCVIEYRDPNIPVLCEWEETEYV